MVARKGLFLLITSALAFSPIASYSATATVDFSATHQTIDGFGGCTAWSGKLSDAQMDVLFGNGTGQLGLNILRLRIDPHAAWADEKSNATKAKARGATVFATPWAYPESLTTNNATVKGYINTAKFASIAAYLKSFWTYCGSDNVDIMSIENEPDYAQSITYEGCTWTAQNFLAFCKTYAPQVGKPIMMPESMNYNTTLSDATLNDATAAANVTYIGGHFYGGTPRNKYTLALNQKKHIWQTEHYITGDGATSCMNVAQEILDCLNNLDFNGYVWWWMTYNTNDGICSGTTPNHRGWVLAQFSKWVRPGYIRVSVTPYSVQSGVNAVAFRGAQNVVVVMNKNTSSQSVTFSFSNAAVTSVHKYTSSQTKNGADEGTIAATNNSFTATLDAQSVTTFVSAGTVGVMPVPERGMPVIGIVRSPGATSQCMYLVNGRRLRFDGVSLPDRPVPGIYIMPGQSSSAGGAGIIVKTSGR